MRWESEAFANRKRSKLRLCAHFKAQDLPTYLVFRPSIMESWLCYWNQDLDHPSPTNAHAIPGPPPMAPPRGMAPHAHARAGASSPSSAAGGHLLSVECRAKGFELQHPSASQSATSIIIYYNQSSTFIFIDYHHLFR